MSRPDSLVVHVGELRRRPGTRKRLRRQVSVPGVATSAAAVAEDADVQLDLLLESIPEGVVVTGTITAPWTGECRRCLRRIVGTQEVGVREVFETKAVEGETWPLHGEHLDLGPLVREVVLLDLPLAPLCDEACRGPAPEAFPATVEGEGEPDDEQQQDGGPPPRDPRWAALDDLRFGDPG